MDWMEMLPPRMPLVNLLAQLGLPGLRNVEIWSSAQLCIRLSLGITPHCPIALKTPASNLELLSPNTQQV